jgi:hypothetical protein
MDQEAVVKDRRLETKKKTMNTKILITGIVVYIVSAVVSFLIFSGLSGPSAVPVAAPKKTASGGLMFDDSLPKTESCPINGAKYSKQQRAWWEKHEPLGVMIENHTEARPQSGISFADVVYEAIAGKSALFKCHTCSMNVATTMAITTMPSVPISMDSRECFCDMRLIAYHEWPQAKRSVENDD